VWSAIVITATLLSVRSCPTLQAPCSSDICLSCSELTRALRYGAALNSGVPDGANSLMGTGIAGGLSTFSSFTYGVVVLATASATGALVVSLVMGYVAVVAGLMLGGKD
jgi:fluoride ion exporter CrcB/FEX